MFTMTLWFCLGRDWTIKVQRVAQIVLAMELLMIHEITGKQARWHMSLDIQTPNVKDDRIRGRRRFIWRYTLETLRRYDLENHLCWYF